MFDQYLPTYRSDFRRDLRWIVRRLAHYMFHYFKDSSAAADIAKIIAGQEKAYTDILAFLRLPDPPKPIEYFLYPDR